MLEPLTTTGQKATQATGGEEAEVTLTDDSVFCLAGGYSLKATPNTTGDHIYLQFPRYNHTSLDLTSRQVTCTFWVYRPSPARIQVILVDDEGHEAVYPVDVDCSNGNWQKIEVTDGGGYENLVLPDDTSDGRRDAE